MQGLPYDAIQPDPSRLMADTLRAELLDLLQITRVHRQDRGRSIAFVGQLLHDPGTSFDEIERRFRPHGYTPMLRREQGEDVVVAMQGIITQARTGNPLINVLLFVATVVTTLSAGAQLAGEATLLDHLMSPLPGRAVLDVVLAGAPFALTLLTILGVHELGHYFAARFHRVDATLPYFIPMPLGGLGTLGAFIAVRSPMKDRTVLFDIGLAGPLAGFVVALPLLVVGLLLSNPVPYFSAGLTLRALGSSPLVSGMVALFADVPAGQTLHLHPVFFAAWFGLLITGVNLLPIGQLDGGHVSYALLGRRAHQVAYGVFLLLFLAGALLSPTWFFWAFFVLLGGLRHAPPMNDITGLNRPRKVLAVCTTLLFFLLIVPAPFST